VKHSASSLGLFLALIAPIVGATQGYGLAYLC